MLSEQEEQAVDMTIALLKTKSHSDKLVPSRVLWLAEKLKEVNEECSRVTLELQEANEAIAKAVDSGGYF